MTARIVGVGWRDSINNHSKYFKMMQNAEASVKGAADLITQHSLDADTARRVVIQQMLGDQPLQLKGSTANPDGQSAPN